MLTSRSIMQISDISRQKFPLWCCSAHCFLQPASWTTRREEGGRNRTRSMQRLPSIGGPAAGIVAIFPVIAPKGRGQLSDLLHQPDSGCFPQHYLTHQSALCRVSLAGGLASFELLDCHEAVARAFAQAAPHSEPRPKASCSAYCFFQQDKRLKSLGVVLLEMREACNKAT